MEDAATAEISRAQVWQWVHHQVSLSDGTLVTAALVRTLLDHAVESLVAAGSDATLLSQARAIFEQVALADDFPPFLTLPAYELLP
jgi:malate synthase